MKKLLILLSSLIIPTTVSAQVPEFWWGLQTYSVDKNGGSIEKGDTVYLEVKISPNNGPVRSTYFDFQHQKDAIKFLGIERREAIPSSDSVWVDNYSYPYCKFNRNSNNTTQYGYTNHQYASYTCDSSIVPYDQINRIYFGVAGNTNITDIATYARLKFEITNTDAGFPYDSVYMNFAYSYDSNGNLLNAVNSGPKGTWIELADGSNNLVSGELKHSTNTSSSTKNRMKLDIYNASNSRVIRHSIGTGNGRFGFAETLNQNENYRFKLNIQSPDSLAAEAITVSDYTAAFNEFLTQNLDGTYKNENLDHGMNFWAADINDDKKFDGGDVQLLFNHVTGFDTIQIADSEDNLPIFTTTDYNGTSLTSWKNIGNRVTINTAGGQVEWVVIYSYDSTNKRYRIGLDSREFPTGSPAWNTITHLKLFDLYDGPVVPKSSDGTWNEYWINTNTQLDFANSAFSSYIRSMSYGNYALRAELTFSESNIRELPITTTTSDQSVDWSYAFKGDVNLSHSSPLNTQSSFVARAMSMLVEKEPSIDLNLNNVLVTTNEVSIPFNVDTKGMDISALQFELTYDPTKLKFEELKANTPSWVTFVNNGNGVLKFGGLDRNLDNTITGKVTPFTVRFTSIGAGADLNSHISLTRNLDAANDIGNQVGMNINTTVIRLTGVNNFSGG